MLSLFIITIVYLLLANEISDLIWCRDVKFCTNIASPWSTATTCSVYQWKHDL